MGSMIASFEEAVPMVPIVVALAVRLGWNPLVGLGMSILAIGCGFSAGVCNPFTVGVAQELAGLPMFSGIWFRIVAFGDGFSNVLYPTNPVLLISLGLADVDYGKWFKWSWKFQFLNLLLTSALLLLGLLIGY